MEILINGDDEERRKSIFNCTKKVLTMKEASLFSGIPMSTLYKHSHKRRFAFSKPTNKVIFIETESFLKWLLQNPQKTAAEMQSDALNFSKRKPKN